MRVLTSIIVIALAICPMLHADDIDIARAKAKASLELRQVQRDREAVTEAKERATEALRVRTEQRKLEHGECCEDVALALAKAKDEGRMIFLWVGFSCKAEPTIRKAFPDAVHCHIAEMNGDKTERIIAGKVGETRRFDRKDFNANTPGLIRSTLTPVVPMPVSYVAPMRAAVSC